MQSDIIRVGGKITKILQMLPESPNSASVYCGVETSFMDEVTVGDLKLLVTAAITLVELQPLLLDLASCLPVAGRLHPDDLLALQTRLVQFLKIMEDTNET